VHCMLEVSTCDKYAHSQFFSVGVFAWVKLCVCGGGGMWVW
jgi:hypothetical protein